MLHFEKKYMSQALEHAVYGQISNEVPVGAIIVKRDTGQIIASAYNQVEIEGNPLRHAEIIVIEKACKDLNTKNLRECDLYVTLEPCTMCSGAIALSKIGRIFYGLPDPKQGAVENGVRFFTAKTCLHRPEIYENIMASESKELMQAFFAKLRQK